MAANRSSNATVPAHGAYGITPSDTNVIQVTRAIYIGISGDLQVRMADGATSPVFSNVPVGIFPIQCDMVLASNTTAGAMVALY